MPIFAVVIGIQRNNDRPGAGLQLGNVIPLAVQTIDLHSIDIQMCMPLTLHVRRARVLGGKDKILRADMNVVTGHRVLGYYESKAWHWIAGWDVMELMRHFLPRMRLICMAMGIGIVVIEPHIDAPCDQNARSCQDDNILGQTNGERRNYVREWKDDCIL